MFFFLSFLMELECELDSWMIFILSICSDNLDSSAVPSSFSEWKNTKTTAGSKGLKGIKVEYLWYTWWITGVRAGCKVLLWCKY